MEASDFKTCWAAFVRRQGLPADPLAILPPRSLAQARREALKFFSQGCVHQAATRARLARLLGDGLPGGEACAKIDGN